MKTELKVDPYHYPVIIIVAFVIGFILAIAVGFRPEHGNRDMEGQGFAYPAVFQTMTAQDVYGL